MIYDKDSCIINMSLNPKVVCDAMVSSKLAQSPQYPFYVSYMNRLKSHEQLPKQMSQTPYEFARAGFFYTGKSDEVVCCICGGGLKDWQINDTPAGEHRRFFGPLCIESYERIHGRS